jgi:hypothetical protein
VAALSIPDPRPDGTAHPHEDPVRVLRELGASTVPTFGALERRPDGGSRLVVVERALKRAFDDAEIAEWIRNARRLAALDHPNLVRVRDVIIRSDEVRVVSDFVDGVRWTELASATASRAGLDAARPKLEAALRVFVDALSGLSALHNLRDASRQPLKLVHGGLTPDCIIVGSDGIARVAGASRLRSATARLPHSGIAYLAPEVLLEDDTADARADVYSLGVMLWEVLSGRPFLPNQQPSAIVTLLLSGHAPAVAAPQAIPWAAPLAHVVARALSADPEKRFASASIMAAELRRIAASRLETAARMASQVDEAFGDVIRARRKELERGVVADEASLPLGTPRRGPEEGIDIDVDEEIAEASSTAPTVPPPAPAPEPRDLLPAPVPAAPPPYEEAIATTPLPITVPLEVAEISDPSSPTHLSKIRRLLALLGSVGLGLVAAIGWLGVRPSAPAPLAHAAPPAAPASPQARPREREEPKEILPALPTVITSAAPAPDGPGAAAAPSTASRPSTPSGPGAAAAASTAPRPSSNAPAPPLRRRTLTPRLTTLTTRRAYDPEGI